MSEALFNRIAAPEHEAQSAGTEPASHVHPNVVLVMREDGIALDGRVPRMLTDELARWADVVVTMGCGDSCPVIPGKRYIDWELTDPNDLPLEKVRTIRDDIKVRVAVLLKDLDHAAVRG